MQKRIWADREWGRTANYVVPLVGQENGNGNPPLAIQGQGEGDVQMGGMEEEEMQLMDDGNGTIGDLEQFQWP